jgi:uncharacterized membrane protein YbhN (UPF0104 family)
LASQSKLWLWRALVAAAAFAAALTLVEPSAWRLAASRPEWLLPALTGWLANQVFCAIRFFILATCAGVAIPFPASLRMTLVANFAGCVFGGFAANDVARLLWLRQADTGARLPAILTLILLDRGLGLMGYAAWAFALSFVVSVPNTSGATTLVDALRLLCVALVVAVVLSGFVVTMLARRRNGDGGLVDRAARIIALAVQPRIALGLLAASPLTLLSAGAVIVAQGYLGVGIADALGHPAPFVLHAFLAPASIIVSILPLVPLGIGLGQLTLSGLYALFGLYVEAAVLLTTVMQVAQFAIAVASGAPVLATMRRRARQAAPGEGRR